MTKNKTKTRKVGDVILTAEVSPCVWMYKGHPFQIKVDMGNKENRQSGGCAYLQDKALNNDTYTEMDIVRLLGTVKIQECKNKGCSNPAFHPDHESNRKGECEHCFMAKWQKNWDAMQEKENAKIARQDKKMKAKGMVARVEAWIHPKAGGDDYMIDIYYSDKPTPAEIESALRERGSAVLSDYRVVNL